MVDIATVGAALSGIKAAIGIAKQIKDSDICLEKADMKMKLADLMTALADVRGDMAEIQALILEKDSEIRELKDALKLAKQMRYEAPYYWRDTESGKEGPFCQKCYDTELKAIRLQKGCNNDGTWFCRACKNAYSESNY